MRRLLIDSATELEGVWRRPSALRCFSRHSPPICAVRTVTTYMTVDVPTIVGSELSFTGTPLVVEDRR